MSTAKIREMLRLGRSMSDETGHDTAEWDEALAALKDVEKAAQTLDRLNVGDFTYNIRDRAAGDASFTGNTWEHPDVKAWSDASVLMGNIAKESK